MTNSSPNPEFDQDFAVVTAERIGEILHGEGLEFLVEQKEADTTVARTGFINQSIVFVPGSAGTTAQATWRGRLSAEDAARGLAMVNEWNLHQINPIAFMLESESGEIAFGARRSLHSVGEVSTNQLGAFVVSSIDSFVGLWNYFESALPESVTWE